MSKEYCKQCGRELIIRIHKGQGFNSKTGKPNGPRETLECPQYKSSWRNLWAGGVEHTGYSLVPDGTRLVKGFRG